MQISLIVFAQKFNFGDSDSDFYSDFWIKAPPSHSVWISERLAVIRSNEILNIARDLQCFLVYTIGIVDTQKS